MSSTVDCSGMLTVLEIAPLKNGWAAAIMRMWAFQGIDRVPFRGVKAQSNTGRCSSFKPGAPSMVSCSSMNARILGAVEQLTGKSFPEEVFERIAHGADEAELVAAGLEETMVNGYNEIREIQGRFDGEPDLRTAAFIDAIDKVAVAYLDRGIFP